MSSLRAPALMQVLGQGGTAQGTTRDLQARARPQRVKVTEHYAAEQDISRNPTTSFRGSPTADIALTMPYDGYKYFTRQAMKDVAGELSPHVERDALIGHLLLTDYGKTDLGEVLRLDQRYGAVPLRVPVTTDTGLTAEGSMADRQTCLIRYEYEPSQPSLLPIGITMELYDPDSLDLPAVDFGSQNDRQGIEDVSDKIRQQVSFRHDLVLRIVVELHIPARPGKAPQPKLTRMAIGWPTITSLRSLQLRTAGRKNQTFEPTSVTYNPVTRRLEWSGVELHLVEGSSRRKDIRTYRSPDMLLSIEHPGELYRQPTLDAHADVEIIGYLLSGLDARLYDACGRLTSSPQPELKTHVSSTATLTLDDAFAKREFSPFHHLYFDEIIPDEMRITDIVTALKDRGFEIRERLGGGSQDSWLLIARRHEGPDVMELWIFAEGRHFETERESRISEGNTYKSRLQSGELRVFIRGTLPRDSRELTHEMNALQGTLRERYERVRQRR